MDHLSTGEESIRYRRNPHPSLSKSPYCPPVLPLLHDVSVVPVETKSAWARYGAQAATRSANSSTTTSSTSATSTQPSSQQPSVGCTCTCTSERRQRQAEPSECSSASETTSTSWPSSPSSAQQKSFRQRFKAAWNELFKRESFDDQECVNIESSHWAD